MDFLNAVILGLIEGLTEFLPISSTGHLILANQFFAFSSKTFTDTFNVVIQTGAILAVLVYFRKKFLPREHGRLQLAATASLWLKTTLAIVPAIVAALFLDDTISEKLFGPVPVAAALLFWGIMMIVLELRNKQRETAGIAPRIATVEAISWQTALFIGLFQCIAMWPGTSRSGATIIGAMLLGASRIAAAEFSFFLAVPTILGASAYKLFKLLKTSIPLGSQEILLLAVGSVVAFFSALAVISLFMNFIRQRSFIPFGVYRIILGSVVLALAAFGILHS